MKTSQRGLLAVFVSLLAIVAAMVVYWREPRTGVAPAEVPVAAASTNTAPVKLTNHFNADLDVAWNRTSYPGDDLAELPRGLQEFDGVRFDIQGVIQLSGRVWQSRRLRFPEKVQGIPIERVCRYLYL